MICLSIPTRGLVVHSKTGCVCDIMLVSIRSLRNRNADSRTDILRERELDVQGSKAALMLCLIFPKISRRSGWAHVSREHTMSSFLGMALSSFSCFPNEQNLFMEYGHVDRDLDTNSPLR